MGNLADVIGKQRKKKFYRGTGLGIEGAVGHTTTLHFSELLEFVKGYEGS